MHDGECPFLRPARLMAHAQAARRDREVVGIYCALPARRVCVPSRIEAEMFCRPNDFESCPYYRRYARVR